MLFEKHATPEKVYAEKLLQPQAGHNHPYFYYYQQFLQQEADWSLVTEARCFLENELELVECANSPLPATLALLEGWMQKNISNTGKQYQQYLQQRKDGSGRLYFPSKSHALLFLQAVEPTKSVDGAWLYATTKYWQDPKYYPLIQIYLEELGYGKLAQNHVSLYKRLLQLNGIQPERLPDAYYRQACIQLAFAIAGDDFLPEMVGFNLAYEQTPLHLLISTYELTELGIDPYYFSLHITIDNAGSGHARQATEALFNFMPVLSSKENFYQRLRQGAKLSEVGLGITEIISRINLQVAVIDLFRKKACIGQFVHSDRCQIEGRGMNEWLANPSQIPHLLQVLQQKKWIKLNQDPLSSPFWQLISGDTAVMKGVFNPAELQVVYDWIAGTWQVDNAQRLKTVAQVCTFAAEPESKEKGENEDINELYTKLGRTKTSEEKMEQLIPFLSPALHHTELGLWATSQYALLFNPGLVQAF